MVALKGGIDILCMLAINDDGLVFVMDPIQVVEVDGQTMLTPWLNLTNDRILRVNTQSIVLIAGMTPEALEGYMENRESFYGALNNEADVKIMNLPSDQEPLLSGPSKRLH